MAYAVTREIMQFARLQDKRVVFVQKSTIDATRWLCISKNRQLLGVIAVDDEENYTYWRV